MGGWWQVKPLKLVGSSRDDLFSLDSLIALAARAGLKARIELAETD